MTSQERVLNWINKQRVRFGEEPIAELASGMIKNMNRCVLANSFDTDAVNVMDVQVTPSERTYPDSDVTYLVRDSYDPSRPWGNLSFFVAGGWTMKSVALPKYVAQFAVDFDNNKFPELVEGEGYL